MLLAASLCVSTLINSAAIVSYAGSNEPVNEARGKAVTASSVEAPSVLAENAVDGDRYYGDSRWGSSRGSGPEWFFVDLGKETDVKCFCTYWESAKADKYKIQIANTEATPGENDWITVAAFNESPEPILYKDVSVLDAVVLPEVKKARYVRLYIDHYVEEDPMGRIPTWPSISIMEFEVYGDIPSDILPIYNDDKNSAAAIDSKINDIGNVTPEKETAINEAREAYDALSSKDQFYVTKYDVLEKAEKKLEMLKQPADYSAVDKALADAKALDKDLYVDFTKVDEAVKKVVPGKNMAEQAEVDKMASDINEAIKGLVKITSPEVDQTTGKTDITTGKTDIATGKTNVTTKDNKTFAIADAANPDTAKTEIPKTGDNNNMIPWMMGLVTALAVAGFAVVKRKKY